MTAGAVKKGESRIFAQTEISLYKGAIHVVTNRRTRLVIGSHPQCKKNLFSFRNTQLNNVLVPELFHNFPCN